MSHLFFMLMAWTVVAVFSGGTIPEERASYANAPQLHSLINRCQPHVVVELGSCSSVATWDLARCIPPSGVLYAVDDWKEGALRQEFLFQAQALGLSEKVIPLEMEGGLFSQVHPDLVFLNARPTTVYRDLSSWYLPTRVLCGNGWSDLETRRSIQQFVREKRLAVKVDRGFWQLAQSDHFLTFIIPCYNCAAWIQEAVESILNQKNLRCPFEIICTDDASGDQTYEVLCALREKHPEIRLFQHAKNRGGGAARNTCVSHAQGDLIFCLDADNVLVPNSVQILIDTLDQTGHDAVAFGMVQYFVGKQTWTDLIPYEFLGETYDLREIVQNPITPPWSGNYLYTKESFVRVGGYPKLPIDTYAFGFLQVQNGFKMSHVPNTFYLHRHGIISYYIRESASQRLPKSFFSFLLERKHLFTPKTVQMLEKHKQFFAKKEPCTDHIGLMSEKCIEVR